VLFVKSDFKLTKMKIKLAKCAYIVVAFCVSGAMF